MTLYEILSTRKEKTDTYYPRVARCCDDSEKHNYDLSFNNFLYKNFNHKEKGTSLSRLITEQDIVIMQFCINGVYTYKNTQGKKLASLKALEYNILFIPKGEFLIDLTGEESNCINIYIKKDFFWKHMPEGYFNQKSDGIAKVFPKNLYINSRLKSVLNEVNACEFEGHLRLLYIKAKIIELLTLQLAQYEEEKSTPSLKPIEIEKMMLVKNIIESNLTETHTITSLARAVGTNEQYLKTHFKILFGSTVFGHVLSCKMQKAKEMLLTGKYRITEIAEIVGYKHATHFTSAFKKFFGYLPQTLKTSKIFFGTYFSIGFELEAVVPLLIG